MEARNTLFRIETLAPISWPMTGKRMESIFNGDGLHLLDGLQKGMNLNLPKQPTLGFQLKIPAIYCIPRAWTIQGQIGTWEHGQAVGSIEKTTCGAIPMNRHRTTTLLMDTNRFMIFAPKDIALFHLMYSPR